MCLCARAIAETMVVECMEVISDTILKPYTPPPPSPPHHPLFNTSVELTIFDRATFDLHVSSIYAFRPHMPDNHAMKEGLSKALFHFPHLAGRLSSDELRRPCIILNDAGVRVIETQLSTSLEEHLPLDPSSPELGRFYPPVVGGEELLQVQLNRFACGGLVIGFTSHHRVADGQSMNFFLLAWAGLVRGLDPDPLPYHDRFAISIPRSPPICEFNHRAVEFREVNISKAVSPPRAEHSLSIHNLVVRFSPQFLSKLKAKFTCDDPSRRYSTFQCLLTHLWKKITMVRGLREEEVTRVRVAVNGRARMRPRVPMEYFGNLVLWAYPRLTGGELLRESYAYVADAIREAVSAVNDDYFRSFIDFGELVKGEEGEEAVVATAAEPGTSLCPDLEVDSWLSFQYHDLDFGGGAPCAFLPPNLPVDGLLIFVPSCEREGGVDVFMALQHEHVEAFKKISHRLD